jgi:predicted O-methyltransferase YrrM
MAISLEAAAFLWTLCEHLKPVSILDLGSGFSSFVLRAFAASYSATVCTVDDDSVWLERTRQFLTAHGLGTEDMKVFGDLTMSWGETFDLVFYDLGGMATRAQQLPSVLERVGQRSVLVLDDMHKEEYVPAVERALRPGRWRYFDARAATMDNYGRFCGVVLRANHSLLQSAFP